MDGKVPARKTCEISRADFKPHPSFLVNRGVYLRRREASRGRLRAEGEWYILVEIVFLLLSQRAMEEVMEGKSLAHLTLKVDPAALREIIAKGELLKFADAVAAQAAAQISAQIVWHVAGAQGRPAGVGESPVAEIAFEEVFLDGEPGYGTGRFPPHWPPVVVVPTPVIQE
jgi:hypothetical protein